MPASFTCLLFPFSGICVGVAAGTLFSCRCKSWYFMLWLPIAVWSLIGTMVFLSSLGLLFTVGNESGEAAGFAGFGAIIVMGRTMFFVLGLIFCCIAYPRKEAFRLHFIGGGILSCILLWAVVAWQTHYYQSPQGTSLLQSPLLFYGKVIDENNHPILGVKVSYTAIGWNESGKEIRNIEAVTSDKRGVFRIDGVPGVHLFIQLSDSHYYSYPENSASFDKRTRPTKGYFPDSEEHAELFRMHSKGIPVPLVHRRGGANVPENGGSIPVIFYGQQDNQAIGTLQIEAAGNTPKNWSPTPYDWSVRLTVPNGGLVESTNQFDFVAPDSGYQPSIEIDMKKDQQGWSDTVNKSYFVKLVNGYARMNIHMRAKTPLYSSFDYYYNPDGSQNLEPQ
jgi:hypothetical protein